MRTSIIFSFFMVFVALTATAQSYYQDAYNSEMLRHAERREPCRKEIVLPQVNGYNIYKADLHTHSVFSDGSVLPKWRVEEAWQDGLDVMAVTEHIEWRPSEKTFVDYLENYRDKKYNKAINTNLVKKASTEEGIMTDLNYGVREAQKAAQKFGLVIIPGSEITRDGKTIGHFNALFTTDNNLTYDPDPVQSIRNAKAQHALVMHNHPGWTRTNIDFTEAEKVAYSEGLIDGVEVMNGSEFYPGIVDRVKEYGQFIAANSDIHRTTANDYRLTGVDRPMTLIFAKDNSLEALKEALVEDRTLAYGYNTLCGDEQLLKDFFVAGMKVNVIRESGKQIEVALTNMTSIPYTICQEGHNQKKLDPFRTIIMSVDKKASALEFSVLNMFCSKDGHPVVELPFK